MEPRRSEEPVLRLGGKVPVDEHTITVGEAGGSFADAPLLRPAADDVHFDPGPRLGEVIGQLHDTFQALVTDQAAHRDQPGVGTPRPKDRHQGCDVPAGHTVVNELDRAGPSKSGPHGGDRRLRHRDGWASSVDPACHWAFKQSSQSCDRAAEVGAELFVVDVVDDDRHAGAAAGHHKGREERDAVLAVQDEVVVAAA